ncbi:nitroreductase/quinone reductase family protein [Micromonospora sp. RTGN7]|uniref:nitroreductase/quinone reductase family protein n=1 Tax=Micromonospora sp. RTGN7 TaxID=3016526 RepID=UPI0029FF1322|nr:nitroreductase/quinone reductase family protein [Micromonospora sp. RTGN7]
MPDDFNQQVIKEFRAHGGRVGGWFEGARLLLLTTTGARTGVPHTTPLGHLTDERGRVLVIASAGGAPRDPQWLRNLRADPRCSVEDATSTWRGPAGGRAAPHRPPAHARPGGAAPRPRPGPPGGVPGRATGCRAFPSSAARPAAPGPCVTPTPALTGPPSGRRGGAMSEPP